MTEEGISKARKEANRFLDAVKEWSVATATQSSYSKFGNKHSGAVKRASLDLTRALAEMRKS